MYALIFVVISVIWAPLGIHSEKITHLILIQRERAGIVVRIFVVLIKFARFAACLVLYSVLREIHSRSEKSTDDKHESKQRECADTAGNVESLVVVNARRLGHLLFGRNRNEGILRASFFVKLIAKLLHALA